MEAVNANASALLPLTNEPLDGFNLNNNNGFVNYHLNKFLATHFHKTPQEIADASRTVAESAAIAAKKARTNANEKAVAAARAVAAAKTALELVGSFSNQAVIENHVAADEDDDLLLLSNGQDLPSSSKHQPSDIMSIASSSCQHNQNNQLSVELRESPSAEHDAISMGNSVVGFNGGAMELGSSSRMVESSEGAANEGTQPQPTRKRGRPPKSMKR